MSYLSMYSPYETWKEGDDPETPYVYVKVGDNFPENGNALLGRKLMTVTEINEIVKELKSDLDKFSREAKRELKALRKKMGLNS